MEADWNFDEAARAGSSQTTEVLRQTAGAIARLRGQAARMHALAPAGARRGRWAIEAHRRAAQIQRRDAIADDRKAGS
jgi:hypothetical protein